MDRHEELQQDRLIVSQLNFIKGKHAENMCLFGTEDQNGVLIEDCRCLENIIASCEMCEGSGMIFQDTPLEGECQCTEL